MFVNQADLVQTSVSLGSNIHASGTDASESECSRGNTSMIEKPSGVCCSCSKKSLCKTLKCGCRAAASSCGASCGCALAKCTNNKKVPFKLDDISQPKMPEDIAEEPKGTSHDTILIQNKTVKNIPETNEDCGPRKQPLREIGNTLVCFPAAHLSCPHLDIRYIKDCLRVFFPKIEMNKSRSNGSLCLSNKNFLSLLTTSSNSYRSNQLLQNLTLERKAKKQSFSLIQRISHCPWWKIQEEREEQTKFQVSPYSIFFQVPWKIIRKCTSYLLESIVVRRTIALATWVIPLLSFTWDFECFFLLK